ncbi:excalibur calcium-binding domain-containing protein [Altererythrobacter sp. CC-YST694]|uniref:thermonuclease family protein n=1 Tax=Altererythrobacter sp. CC-YST694 TaxID=2755038 RepID=UPI001D02D953|nr:excalibur calcium-binding domain-containing protein [Altererythrobacter sp. CC-YST694]MCB5423970.1 excalibur calcium-binding domain-containing protein [Altererythrobacter sp. CC-YST694]
MKWAFALALTLLPAPAFAQLITGKAQAIDGDTLRMDGFRIRLHGVDAPEAEQTCLRDGGDWACGQASKAALAALVDGKQVECEQKSRDNFGRPVALCRAGGIDMADEQARLGMVVALPDFSLAYVDSEALARTNRLGIWGSQFQMPADYRAAHPEKYSRAAPPQRAIRNAAPARPAVFYRNCNEARAAGAAPLYRGQPGYRPEMDGDNDGIACEPYRGRR